MTDNYTNKYNNLCTLIYQVFPIETAPLAAAAATGWKMIYCIRKMEFIGYFWLRKKCQDVETNSGNFCNPIASFLSVYLLLDGFIEYHHPQFLAGKLLLTIYMNTTPHSQNKYYNIIITLQYSKIYAFLKVPYFCSVPNTWL